MHNSKLTGFSLVEVLVALSILILISLGVIQLIIRSDQVAEAASEQFVAINIAREGLELTRSIRDNNWFTKDRSEWIGAEMCGEFIYDIDMLATNATPAGSGDGRLYLQPAGHWGHSNTGELNDTRYSRVLEVDCSEKDADPPRVVSTARVTWEHRGQPEEVVLQEKLYNWLP